MSRLHELNGALQAHVEIDVPFHDSDPMGVTWHGNYFRYLESARSKLLTQIGYNYADMIASGYLKPTVFGQRLKVTATLLEYENRLKLAYTIVDCGSGETVTKAQTVQVAVAKGSGEMCFCSPQILLDKVRACLEPA
jgi:acyl-CoA thioester hydrolase